MDGEEKSEGHSSPEDILEYITQTEDSDVTEGNDKIEDDEDNVQSEVEEDDDDDSGQNDQEEPTKKVNGKKFILY